jgi:hypothetical protein
MEYLTLHSLEIEISPAVSVEEIENPWVERRSQCSWVNPQKEKM